MKKMDGDMLDEDDLSENINNEVEILLDNIKDINDLYFISLILLNKIKDSNKYSMISELCYLMDTQSFMNLLYYFEGMTITIPTREELRECLQMLSLYYYYEVLNLEWKESLNKIGIQYSKQSSNECWKKYKKFKKELVDVEFPKILRMSRMNDKLRMEGIDE